MNAARSTPLRTILEFLESRRGWVEKKLDAFARQERELPPRRLTEGAAYPFMGEDLVLKAVPTPLNSIFVSRAGGELLVHLPRLLYAQRGTDLSFARQALREFYRQKGSDFLRERAAEWSSATGLVPSKIRIKETKTRWGSCSPDRVIALNWRLIVYRPDLIDGVIVHELSHLKHMNHSRRFWDLVESILPASPELTREIRERHRLGDFLDENER